jgi:serine/threonine-protein kinase
MAPEQFHGKAVFASDIYSLGVTMYQMLTGTLPYDAPGPSDMPRLLSGELVSPPRLRNPEIPAAVNDLVMRAMAPEVSERYQRASDVLEAIVAASAPRARRTAATAAASRPRAAPARDDAAGPAGRARETPTPRFCWQCRKPLHPRSDRCPFCGESQ